MTTATAGHLRADKLILLQGVSSLMSRDLSSMTHVSEVNRACLVHVDIC